jgi:hypothetical protein
METSTNHCPLPECIEQCSVVTVLVAFLNQHSKAFLGLDGIVHTLSLELVLQLSCFANEVPKRQTFASPQNGEHWDGSFRLNAPQGTLANVRRGVDTSSIAQQTSCYANIGIWLQTTHPSSSRSCSHLLPFFVSCWLWLRRAQLAASNPAGASRANGHPAVLQETVAYGKQHLWLKEISTFVTIDILLSD